MGIENINKLIKRHCPDALITLPITALSGKRVAIDTSLWMRANMRTARKIVIERLESPTDEINSAEITREWMLLATNFAAKWIEYQVGPIFILDGAPPIEKNDVVASRKAKDIALLSTIESLYQQLSENPAIFPEFKREFSKYTCISKENYEIFITIMKRIGIPCIQAKSEAEHLCSMLYRDGKVAGIFSTDTDILAYGGGLLITKFSKSRTKTADGTTIPCLNCVRIDKVLEGLKLTYSEFIDLCIMSGCDYNKHMPGYACIKSYKLINQHKSIDKLPRHLPVPILNHVRCRELFSYVKYPDLISHDTENTLILRGLYRF